MDDDIDIDLGHGEEVDINFDFGGGQDLNFGDLGDANVLDNIDSDFAAWDPLNLNLEEDTQDGKEVGFDVKAYNWDLLGNTDENADGNAGTTPATIAPAPAPLVITPDWPADIPTAVSEKVDIASAPHTELNAGSQTAVTATSAASAPQLPPTSEPTVGLGLPRVSATPKDVIAVRKPTSRPLVTPTSATSASIPSPTAKPAAESALLAIPPAPRKQPDATSKPTPRPGVKSTSAASAPVSGLKPKPTAGSALPASKLATPSAPRKPADLHATLKAALQSTRKPTFASAARSDRSKRQRKPRNAQPQPEAKIQLPITPAPSSVEESDSLFIPDTEGEKEKQERIKQETAVLEQLFGIKDEADGSSAVTRIPPARQFGATHTSTSPARSSPTPPAPHLTSLTGPSFKPFTSRKRKRVPSITSAPFAQPSIKGHLTTTKPSDSRSSSAIPPSSATATMARPHQRADSPASTPNSRSSTPRPTSMANKLWNQHLQRVALGQPLSNDERSDEYRESLKQISDPPVSNATHSPAVMAPANRSPAVNPTLPPATEPSDSGGSLSADAILMSNFARVSHTGATSQDTPAAQSVGQEPGNRISLLPDAANGPQHPRPSLSQGTIQDSSFGTPGSSRKAPPLSTKATSSKPTVSASTLARRHHFIQPVATPAPLAPAKSSSPAFATAPSGAMAKPIAAKPRENVGAPSVVAPHRDKSATPLGNGQLESKGQSANYGGTPHASASNGEPGVITAKQRPSSARPRSGMAIDRSSPSRPASRFGSPQVSANGARTPPVKNFAPKSPARTAEQRSRHGSPNRPPLSTGDNIPAARRHETPRPRQRLSERRSPNKETTSVSIQRVAPPTRAKSPTKQKPAGNVRSVPGLSAEDAEAASIIAGAARSGLASSPEPDIVVSDEASPPKQTTQRKALPTAEQMAQDLIRQPSTRRRDSRLTAAVPDVNTPSCNYLVQAAIQHLNNLTLAFKLHEDEAHEREDHLAALHMQAHEMRADAMAWRKAAMPVILERRERLARLVGLEDREVMRIQDWEELLRPLSK